MKLYTKILIGLVAGAIVGLVANLSGLGWLQAAAVAFEPLGTAFIRLITMIVVPLVIASLLVGTASLGDIHRLGRIGGRSLAFFLLTTIIAASLGLGLAHVFRPGARLDPDIRDGLTARFATEAADRVDAAQDVTPTMVDTFLEIIPRNPIQAAAEMDLLGIIFFTMLLGAAAGLLSEERRRPFLGFFEAVNDISIRLIGWVMKLAPYAVFALIAAVVARFGLDLLRSLLLFCAVVVLGQLLHGLGFFSVAIRLLVGMSPVVFYRRIAKVPLVAFSTSSSSATLPVSIESAERDLGISKEISGFVLPLGATINMNGSALYKAVAVMFIAEVYGVDLNIAQQIAIIVTTTLSAIAGAGVPGSGMVTILIVLNAVGLGPQAQAGVALVIGVDRILDMIRTAVNVTGDMVCAAYIARVEGQRLAPPAPRSAAAAARRPSAVPTPELVEAGDVRDA